MSVEAISWALGEKVERSTAKFVLVALANCANNDMVCWPSVQYLCDATCQDRKTVLENIKRLKEAGLIVDTELRKGATGQVIVYQLMRPGSGPTKEAQKRNSSKNGTVPKTDMNKPVFTAEESRFSAETGPKTGHGTVIEPSLEPSRNHKAVAAVAAPKSPKKSLGKITLKTYIANRQASGLRAFDDGSDIYEYADTIKLPPDFLSIAWHLYKGKYASTGKKYIDWSQAFLNALKAGWLKAWYHDGTNYALTTVGIQAQMEMKARKAA